MDKAYLQETQKWIREELEASLNFWLKNGMDHEHGGVYTCLDRTGRIYSTDKSVWMQGRCGWIYAYMCHLYGAKPEWLEASKSCLDFLEKYCINPKAKSVFILDYFQSFILQIIYSFIFVYNHNLVPLRLF